MRFQPFPLLAVGAAILVGVLGLQGQSMQFGEKEAPTGITSLTNLQTHRRAAVPFGAIDASTAAPVELDVTVQPDPTTGDVANQLPTGGGAGRSMFGGSALKGLNPAATQISTPLPAGSQTLTGQFPAAPEITTTPLIPTPLLNSRAGSTPAWSSSTASSMMPASTASARVSSARRPSARQSFSSSTVPRTQSGPVTGAPYSSLAASSPLGSASARRDSASIGEVNPVNRPRGYLSNTQEPQPGLIGTALPSRSGYRAGVLPLLGASGQTANSLGLNAGNDEDNQESVDPSGLSSDSGQNGAGSGRASKSFFESPADPFGELFQNDFQSFTGGMEFTKACGEACKLGVGRRTRKSDASSESESEEADQNADQSSDQNNEKADQGHLDWRSRRDLSRREGQLGQAHATGLLGKSRRRRGLLESESRSVK